MSVVSGKLKSPARVHRFGLGIVDDWRPRRELLEVS
jgi:hypothetical protein